MSNNTVEASWSKVFTSRDDTKHGQGHINSYASTIVEKWPTKEQQKQGVNPTEIRSKEIKAQVQFTKWNIGVPEFSTDSKELVSKERCVLHAAYIIRKNRIWNYSFDDVMRGIMGDSSLIWYNKKIFDEAVSLVRSRVQLDYIQFPTDDECRKHINYLKKTHPKYDNADGGKGFFNDLYMYFNVRYYNCGSSMFDPFESDED